jgi:DNA-binding PadR family transcriptional regulator
VRRLQRCGFIRANDHATGRKQSKRYVLTAAGKRELRRWLGPPVTEGTVGVPMDPSRNRLLYLRALPADQQASFLRSADLGLRHYLEQLMGFGVERTQHAGPSHMLILQGAIAMMRSRIEWLHGVIAELNSRNPK